MSQIPNIRHCILEELKENKKANLVDIMARFDFYQHAIPTTNEMRQALKGLDFLDVEKNGKSVIIVKTNSQNEIAYKKITETDMKNSYALYTNKLKISGHKNT